MPEKNTFIDRISFSRILTPLEVPNLLEVQESSFESFLQIDVLPEKRQNIGLQAAFKSIFPIADFKETVNLDFVSYSLGDWKCKCGMLQGMEHAMPVCQSCGAVLNAGADRGENAICPECHAVDRIHFNICEQCGDRVRLKIKYSPEECLDKGFDYGIPIRVKLRLALYTENKKGERVIKDVKEQEIFFGEIPYMTDRGTFIINGTERVVVSQLQRSPGVYFMSGKSRGEYTAKIIPARGAWIELEEKLNMLQVRLDKKTKRINITTFVKAMGMPNDLEILKKFYTIVNARMENGIFYLQNTRFLKESKLTLPVADKSGKEIIPAGTKLTLKHIKDMERLGLEYVPVDMELFEDMYSACELENVLKLNEPIQTAQIKKLRKLDTQFQVFFPESEDEEMGSMLAYTLRKDKKRKEVEIAEKVAIQSESELEDKVAKSQGDAFIEVFKKLRPGEPITLEGSRKFFENMIFDPKRYDLSSVGRLKLNIKLDFDKDFQKDVHTLTLSDMVEIIRYFLRLKYDRTGKMHVDDIDHLANRRIRAVGELVENAFRIGLTRLEKIIKERITNAQDVSVILPKDLLNTKPVFAALKEFFGTSQLSQFMDQTNPLAETTHKRRVSALGPGGLNRERAGFEVRDVHSSHYGRICPIETPEGPNIGLISSLTTFAMVDEYGFIKTPYRKVEQGRVVNYFRVEFPGDSRFRYQDVIREDDLQDEISRLKRKKDAAMPFCIYYPYYLTAWEEESFTIAQANAQVDEKGCFISKKITARRAGETLEADAGEIEFMDFSPKQIVSVSAALIPFLEHDDANRALMGSNMQRQAVPLINPEAAIVATGMEHRLIKDSGMVVVCKRSGVVMNADAQRIIIKVDADGKSNGDFSEIKADLYELKKFRRSNQNTLINQRPLVKVGQKVEKGQILCDGPGSNLGELALGRNILAAFVPWRGYNYEDAIILSERLVKESVFNSIYIVEETIEARETKLGPEEITRDIPGVSETALRNLDENGIVRIGAKVKPGDILVGKVSPKGETQLSPEEKLLRAIFGEQASEIKDSSLYCPTGVEGTVIDVKVFTRRGLQKDKRAQEIDKLEIVKLESNFEDEKKILLNEKFEKIKHVLAREKLTKNFNYGKKYEKGKPIPQKDLEKLDDDFLKEIKKAIGDDVKASISEVEKKVKLHSEALRLEIQEKIDQMRKGDEFAPGIIKIIKVLIAVNRRISVGDKMAGRHGNKGVVAKILPVEDMPFLESGTPVDVVLNPLGVPSRMNVGQVLEMILAWAGYVLNCRFETPVFDGISESGIRDYMEQAGLPVDGKVVLYDGIAGEPFKNKVTVGFMYMMKLEHMVDDKIHARSTGPYSLITQQPLGGKAQFGGQRVGEMEVWALEAYGAAYILQEMLTIKSDNISGRNEIYSAIVKGTMEFSPGLPESFNVLLKELKSLVLNIELIKKERVTEETRIQENIAKIS